METKNTDRVAFAVILSYGAFYLYLSLLVPPGTRGWDATYHLSLAKLYVSTGGIPATTDLILGGVPIYHPPLFHLTMALAYVVFQGFSEVWADNAMMMITPIFSAVTLLAAYKFVANLGDRRKAIVTLFMVSMFPVYIRFSPIPYVEMMTTFFSTVALFMVYKAYQQQSLKHLVSSGILSGLACLTKYSGIIAVATSLVFVLLFWKVGGGLSLRGRVWRRVKAAMVVVLLVAVVAGPWYARNWVLFGSPIAPFVFGDRFTATGNEVAELTQAKVEKTHAYTADQIVALVFGGFWDVPEGSRLYYVYVALALLLSLPLLVGLIQLLRRRDDPAKLVLIWLSMSVAQLLFYASGEPIWVRTIMPGVVAIGFTATLGLFEVQRFLEPRFARYSKRVASALPLMLVFSLALSGLFFNAFGAYRFMREGETTKEYFPAFWWIKRNTPQDAVFLTSLTWDVVYYANRKATWFDERIYAPHKPSVLLSHNEMGIVNYLAGYQINYLLVKKADIDKTVNWGGYPSQFVEFAASSDAFKVVYNDDRVIIFKVGSS